MKTSLAHLPEQKQQELQHITALLQGRESVEMVILFGSYAHGTQVEDIYSEKGTTYEYKSDYDLLVITTHDDLHEKFRIEDQITEEILKEGLVHTPINAIYHSIKHLNKALSDGNYFFKDIKKEGIVLLDKGKVELAEPRLLSPTEAKQKAKEYFDQWFASANDFLFQFDNAFKHDKLNNAAFQLHQAVERYYTTILLVFTDYRPKDHDLERLDLRVRNCDVRFHVFPRTTDQETQLFELLRRAYIDARYKMDEYHITRSDLEYLASKVETLKQLTEEVCLERVDGIG